MIRLKRNQINEDLWNQCVEQSMNPRIYALTWYLDSVCDNWYGLTNENYDFVFPVPISKKWGFIPWVAQPPFCQQLGCFSMQNIDLKVLIDKIAFYPRIHLNLHAFSNFFTTEIKKNSLLNLQSPYQTLRQNYSELRKRELKKIQKLSYQLQVNHNLEESLTFWFEQWEKKDFFQKAWKNVIKKLVYNAFQLNRLYLLTAYHNHQITGVSLFLLDFHRVIYLGGAFTENGVNSFMFDYIIQNFAEKVQYLDFEGSSIPSIQKFYESWGKIEYESYPVLKKFLL